MNHRRPIAATAATLPPVDSVIGLILTRLLAIFGLRTADTSAKPPGGTRRPVDVPYQVGATVVSILIVAYVLWRLLA